MQQRSSDTTVYDRTVTADLYRAQSPDLQIIEDTEAPQASYAELYAGQKQRIKSSVVCPVLSSESVLLGTLVLHCDSKKFFKEKDRRSWRQFCELFTKRLALEKLLLDCAYEAPPNNSVGARLWTDVPF